MNSPRQCDVFLTNYLPQVRQKNKFDVEHIRAANPDIIYVRGSAYGDKGAERQVGGYDGTAFWTRSGIGYTITPEALDGMLSQGMPAFGDSIGGMNIAGGISAALFHRAKTGEALEVDVSLMSSAWWACGREHHPGYGNRRRRAQRHAGNAKPREPLHGQLQNLRRRHDQPHACPARLAISATHLSIWASPELADDPRFAEPRDLIANSAEGSEYVTKAFAAKPFEYWRQHLKTMKGQWAPFQSLLDIATDEQALANDMIVEYEGSRRAAL